MSDTHSPVLVRMRHELKEALQREATQNRRTLTGEINARLQDSFDQPQAPGVAPAPANGNNLPPSYTNFHNPSVVHINHSDTAGESLSNMDRTMLDFFRTLPLDKQLSLMSLFDLVK